MRLLSGLAVCMFFAVSLQCYGQSGDKDPNAPIVTAIFDQILERHLNHLDQDDPNLIHIGIQGRTVKSVIQWIVQTGLEYHINFVANRTPQDVVTLLYKHLLDRPIDPSGLKTWSAVVKTKGYSAAVDGILNSQEYKSRFGDWKVPGHESLVAHHPDLETIQDITWMWNDDGTCAKPECITYLVDCQFGATISFPGSSIRPDANNLPTFRGIASAHSCVEHARQQYLQGNIYMAIAWLQAGVLHDKNAQKIIAEHAQDSLKYIMSL